MTFECCLTLRSTQAQAIQAAIDGGGGAGSLVIYTGSAPAALETSATGTLLVTFTMHTTSFGSAASGVITAAGANISATVAATGTAGYFRFFDSTPTAICQGTVTATGGGGDMTVNDTGFVSGGLATYTGGTITVP